MASVSRRLSLRSKENDLCSLFSKFFDFLTSLVGYKCGTTA